MPNFELYMGKVLVAELGRGLVLSNSRTLLSTPLQPCLLTEVKEEETSIFFAAAEIIFGGKKSWAQQSETRQNKLIVRWELTILFAGKINSV